MSAVIGKVNMLKAALSVAGPAAVFAALFAGALLVSVPAVAEDAPRIDCMANSSDTSLASDVVDDFLAESGIGTKQEGIQERVAAAGYTCELANEISGPDARAYFSANLSFMLAGELRRRIEASGLDIAPADTLVLEKEARPDLDIAEYIDARPAEFVNPAKAAARAGGIDSYVVMAWLGGYIGMKLEERRALALLQSP